MGLIFYIIPYFLFFDKEKTPNKSVLFQCARQGIRTPDPLGVNEML